MASRSAISAVGLAGAVLVASCGQDAGPSPDPEAGGAQAAPGGTSESLPSPTTAAAPPPSTTTAPVAPAHVFPLAAPEVCDYTAGHHDYPAVDIFCPIGTEVVAVTDGIVEFVSRVDAWDPATDDPSVRGGLSVAMVGDDGVRYYGSHLSAVSPGIGPGRRVRSGQRLGLSGQSGNAADTFPHLHFGISHPTTPDDWMVRRGEIDPYPYLRAWEIGENRTPVLP